MIDQSIKFAWEDVGFCRVVYKSEDHNTLYCFQEEFNDHWVFYLCTPDEEPIGSISVPNYVKKDFVARIIRKEKMDD